jgi:hypothetical protein
LFYTTRTARPKINENTVARNPLFYKGEFDEHENKYTIPCEFVFTSTPIAKEIPHRFFKN